MIYGNCSVCGRYDILGIDDRCPNCLSNNMKEVDIDKDILNTLKYIEKKYNIEILFAVESGSRAWRIESKDSDYDIRFLYKRDKKEYLKIHPLRDVIEHVDGEYDFVGFDLYKYIRLLNNSNPSMIEWLNSDIIYLFEKYIEKFLDENINILNRKFNKTEELQEYVYKVLGV